MKSFDIHPIDKTLQTAIQTKIDNLNKPKGSLGRLEELAMQVCLIQHTLEPSLAHPCHLLLGGDHGIEREGVSVSPREVTWQQMINFTHGGGGVNMFCRQHGFKLRIVDVGVDYDLSKVDGIIENNMAMPPVRRKLIPTYFNLGFINSGSSRNFFSAIIAKRGIVNSAMTNIEATVRNLAYIGT